MRADTPWDEKKFIEAIEHSKQLPPLLRFQEISAIINMELVKIILGLKSPEEGMRFATRKIDELLQKV